MWRTVGRLLGVKDAQTAEQTNNQRQSRLQIAYDHVFHPRKRATEEHKEIVLADLMNASGLMIDKDAGTYSTNQLWQEEGKAQLMRRILLYTELSEAELRQLREAAASEAHLTELDAQTQNIGHDL